MVDDISDLPDRIRRAARKGNSAWLEETVTALRLGLQKHVRAQSRSKWAAYQHCLGSALAALGESDSGTARLEEAVAAYRLALKERRRERVPLKWAATQNSLGQALLRLGEREAGSARLKKAVTAFREALKKRNRGRVPLDWAATQHNLGYALSRLGERENGTARLEEAVVAYRLALEERTRKRVPLDWAATQNNLGNTLEALGERESGTARLEEAIAAFQEALKERRRQRVPLDWAMTQNNLGNALHALGERESGTARLEEAERVLRKALRVYTHKRWPLDWAMTQNNLGNVLSTLGERETGTARLEAAATAYRKALRERTRGSMPIEWARIQNNLGDVLRTIGERESGTVRLEEAVTALREALKERTRERVPLQWARTQHNLGKTLLTLGERESGTARLSEAAAVFRVVLQEWTQERVPVEWAISQQSLGQALWRLGEREKGEHWRGAAEAWEEVLTTGLATVFKMSRIPDQRRELRELSGLGDRAALARLRAGDQTAAVKVVHRARAIQASLIALADREAAGDEAAIRLRTRREFWHTANAECDRAYETWEATPHRVTWQQYQTKRRRVERAYAEFRALLPKPRDLDLRDIASALPKGGVLVTLIVAPEGGAALLVRAGSSTLKALELPDLTRSALRFLFEGTATDTVPAWFAGYRHFLAASGAGHAQAWLDWNTTIETTLQRLGKLGLNTLHRWLRDTVKVARDSEVVLSPPGLLAVLPLSAVREPNTGHCLLDDYVVRMIPSGDLLVRCSRAARSIAPLYWSLLAVIDPQKNLLPLSEERLSLAREVSGEIQPEVLLGEAATVARVYERVSSFTHFFHYGHGGWANEGGFLELADGRLTDVQIRRLRLPRSRLVVLAACETGLIELVETADEFRGLVESFLEAGTAGVIGSLWPVDREATRQLAAQVLVAEFSSRTRKTRDSPAYALRHAQLSLRDSGYEFGSGYIQHARPSRGTAPEHSVALPASLPVFWAAFNCTGA